jgi:GntR family transcriptional regulator
MPVKNKKSISQRLHEDLGQVIAKASPGDQLPSEPQLAVQLGVSRATLREAMRTFEIQGLLIRRQGAGTFVAQPSQVIESGLEVLESIETMAKRIGLKVSMGQMDIDSRIPTEVERKELNLDPSQSILAVSRVILAEGHPAAYLVDVLPDDVLDKSLLEKEFTGSVLDVLLKQETLELLSSRCEIMAVTATRKVARFLAIQRGDVLMCFQALLYSASRRVVDYSLSYFLPGYFRFHVVRRIGSRNGE